jgi:hypothetical protein
MNRRVVGTATALVLALGGETVVGMLEDEPCPGDDSAFTVCRPTERRAWGLHVPNGDYEIPAFSHGGWLASGISSMNANQYYRNQYYRMTLAGEDVAR